MSQHRGQRVRRRAEASRATKTDTGKVPLFGWGCGAQQPCRPPCLSSSQSARRFVSVGLSFTLRLKMQHGTTSHPVPSAAGACEAVAQYI